MNERLLKDYVLKRFGIELSGKISDRSTTHIYQGIERKTKDSVVIKVCTLTSHEHLMQLSREVSFLLHSTAPSIASLRDAACSHGYCFMVMDAYPTTLLDLVNAGHNLSAAEAYLLVNSVAEALAYGRRCGLIAHRDIKPSNIFCCFNHSTGALTHFVLGDFGCALFEGARTPHAHQASSLCESRPKIGTHVYCAPEQEEDPHEATFASDMYALGITLFECLTHCAARPPHFCTDYRYRSGVSHLELDAVPHLTSTECAQLNELIQTLTRVDPALRPQSLKELKTLCRDVRKIRCTRAQAASPRASANRSALANATRPQAIKRTLLLCTSFVGAISIGIVCIIFRYLQ